MVLSGESIPYLKSCDPTEAEMTGLKDGEGVLKPRYPTPSAQIKQVQTQSYTLSVEGTSIC